MYEPCTMIDYAHGAHDIKPDDEFNNSRGKCSISFKINVILNRNLTD